METFLQLRTSTRNGAAQSGTYLVSGQLIDGVRRDVYGVGRLGRKLSSWYLWNSPLVMLY